MDSVSGGSRGGARGGADPSPPNSLFSYQTEARRAEENIKTSHPLSKGLYPPLSLPLIGPCQQLKNPAVEGCIGFVLCEVRGFTLVWLIFIFNLFLWRQVTTHFYTFLFASSLFLKLGAITVLGIPSPDKLQDAFTTSTDGPNSNL